jgi:hypothetical protein
VAKNPPPPKEEPFEVKHIDSIAMLMSVSGLSKDIVVSMLKKCNGDADEAMENLLSIMPKPKEPEKPKTVQIIISGLKVDALLSL